MIDRRGLCWGLLLVLCSATALAGSAPTPTPVVQTAQGPVQGLVENAIAAFKGIRYGAPPIGERRFLPPRPADAWTDVYDATGFGAPAKQMYDRVLNGSDLALQLATVFPMRSEMKIDNEDCLFLNVWTPAADDGKRPVMVWFHGGGYAYGSGAWPVYDGANLARKGDVVVVTVNHRLNVFGYLHLADVGGEKYAQSGNAGMLDLVLALEWVRDNVAAFGGDPGNVTIMGESGGGSKVSTLLAMPAANGLFHKAVIQSGPGLTGVPVKTATNSAAVILGELGIDGKSLDAINTLPAEAILAATAAAQAKAGGAFGALPLAPVVDGKVLPRHPFTPAAPEQSKDIPILIGWNKDEMTIFNTAEPWFGTLTDVDLGTRASAVVGDKADRVVAEYRNLYPDYSPTYIFNALLGDSRMFLGSVVLAERKAAQNAAPAYVYYLTWETPVGDGIFKSPHTLDIPFMFNNVDKALALTGDGPEARLLEDQMSSAWIAFARTGNPNNERVPQWPPYDASRRATMVFDVTPRVVNDPNRALRQILAGGD
jgi:para-nitrobenzyl esterase